MTKRPLTDQELHAMNEDIIVLMGMVMELQKAVARIALNLDAIMPSDPPRYTPPTTDKGT